MATFRFDRGGRAMGMDGKRSHSQPGNNLINPRFIVSQGIIREAAAVTASSLAV